MSREKYKQQLENIKQYLINEGLNVTEVTMWQGGFTHEGTKYGLPVIASVIVDGVEERYCVPRYLVRDEAHAQLKFLKME